MSRRLSPQGIPPADLPYARQIAAAIGYLPLAVDLAAGQIADTVPWSALLSDMQAEDRLLERLQTADPELEDEPYRKDLSLLISFSAPKCAPPAGSGAGPICVARDRRGGRRFVCRRRRGFLGTPMSQAHEIL